MASTPSNPPPAVFKPRPRSVSRATRLYLYVQAGGRCEFDGCNKYLLEHPVTGTIGNYAEMGHIYAFSPEGPRGQGDLTADELDCLDNLMLLCLDCHKKVDDEPERYSPPVLRSFKKAHEERVFYLAGTSPDRHTTAIVVKAKIGGQSVEITVPQMQEAVAPEYIDRDQVEIDLTAIPDTATRSYWEACERTIDESIRERFGRAIPRRVASIAVFALAPIPLLVFLGSRLTNKVPVALFQRHRDTERWQWKVDGEPVEFVTRCIATGTDPAGVALVLSLSGPIDCSLLPESVRASHTIYEIALAHREPTPYFLNGEEDLRRFRVAYQEFLRSVSRDHPAATEIHLFPAVPAPVAVACGLDRLPKCDPALVVYDYRRGKGFEESLRINTP